ncbi:MAG: hypothetical protein JXC32_05925 [Anaerolineae bacterium]|nr:hypothetical protein [Anaerolineae bacterium]
MAIPIKLLMTWDIAAGQEEACFAFITQDLPDTMQQAGLELTDAWFTAYGDWPQIRIGFVSMELDELQRFLMSQAWRDLKKKLMPYTRDYRQKVVVARGGFQF